MPQRFHTQEIIDQLVTTLKTSFEAAQPTGLGLKTIAKGGVEFYVTEDTIAAGLPAIFVKPHPTTDLEMVTFPAGYEITHHLRLIYVREWSVSEEVQKEKIADTIRIAEFLLDDTGFTLDGLSLTNGQIVVTMPTGIEWEPVEDDALSVFQRNMVATAINFDVLVKTRRE